MLRPVIRLIINMYIRPLDVRQTFELDLQLFGDVVRSPQTRLWVHDNIDLDDETRTRMICAYGVDLADGWGVCHC